MHLLPTHSGTSVYGSSERVILIPKSWLKVARQSLEHRHAALPKAAELIRGPVGPCCAGRLVPDNRLVGSLTMPAAAAGHCRYRDIRGLRAWSVKLLRKEVNLRVGVGVSVVCWGAGLRPALVPPPP